MTWKIRNCGACEARCTVTVCGEALMVMLLVMTSSAVVSVTIFTEGSKLIVSPSWASASAWRSEPGPLSFVLVTVMYVGRPVSLSGGPLCERERDHADGQK